MRTRLIAGNWKLHTTRDEAVALARAIAEATADAVASGVRVAVCPPFVSVDAVARALDGTGVAVGAQDVSAHEERGAHGRGVGGDARVGRARRTCSSATRSAARTTARTDALVAAKLGRALAQA